MQEQEHVVEDMYHQAAKKYGSNLPGLQDDILVLEELVSYCTSVYFSAGKPEYFEEALTKKYRLQRDYYCLLSLVSNLKGDDKGMTDNLELACVFHNKAEKRDNPE